MWDTVSTHGFRHESSAVCEVSYLRAIGTSEIKMEERFATFS
ncbi:MAG: hypothetical protein AAGC86_10175 [Pseudomonadota bacterium]